MKFEWNPDKNADMNVEVDWNTAVRNPYINKFTREERLEQSWIVLLPLKKLVKKN